MGLMIASFRLASTVVAQWAIFLKRKILFIMWRETPFDVELAVDPRFRDLVNYRVIGS